MDPSPERRASTRRHRRGIAVCVVMLLSLSIVGGGEGAMSQDPHRLLVQRFVGTYRCLRSDGGEEAIRAGVERVVALMGFVSAPIARRRLLEGNPPIPRITIAANGDGMVIDYTAGRRNATTRLGVFTDNPAADGGRVQVKHEIVGGRVRESFRQGSGHGVTLLELSSDGNRLSLRTTIGSRHLPAEVVFGIPYERVH